MTTDETMAAARISEETTLTHFLKERHCHVSKTDSISRFSFNFYFEYAVGQIYYVSPKDDKRYYPRMLLLHRIGPNSFEDIRIVNGELCSTLQEGCVKLDLIVNNEEYDRNIRDAEATIISPDQMLSLF